jgi:hypothetical protein
LNGDRTTWGDARASILTACVAMGW